MRSGVSTRLLAGVVAALLGPSLAVAAPAAAAPRGGEGIGDSYFPLDGNGGYDALRYRIHDHYDFATGRLSGRTRITLRTSRTLTSLNLDFLLPVESVRVDGVRAHVDRPHAHELRITPDRPFAAGQVARVVVRYAGRPGRYGYAGEHNWLADDGEVVAMNEPHMAPWWFPANDHPSDLARMDVFITVPRGRQVISNGLLRGKRRGPRTVRWHWRSDSRMTTYNAFFVAGRYAVERGRTAGIPWLNAASRRLGAVGVHQALASLRPSGEVTHWLADLLGPYPFDATGGVVFGLYQDFALENQTRPTYPFLPDRLLLVHELGHQWFGDSVPVARWRDIWLNEGFATWLEWRWTEEHLGPTANQRLADRFRGGTPAGPTEDPGVDRMWGQAPYLRGAMTLQALRNVLGEDDFDALLRSWVAARAGRPSSSADFEQLAAELSGHDLSAFFDAWLRDVAAPADTEANGLGDLLPAARAG